MGDFKFKKNADDFKWSSWFSVAADMDGYYFGVTSVEKQQKEPATPQRKTIKNPFHVSDPKSYSSV